MAGNWLIRGTSSGFGRTLTELALERETMWWLRCESLRRWTISKRDMEIAFVSRSSMSQTRRRSYRSSRGHLMRSARSISLSATQDTSWSAQQKKRSCQGLSACLIPISWEASYSRKPLFLTCASRAVAESCKSRASRVSWPIRA